MENQKLLELVEMQRILFLILVELQKITTELPILKMKIL